MKTCQETIIILHGWQSSKERWRAVKEKIEKQSEDRPRSIIVVVPDLPGFKKETELNKPCNLDDYIEWFKNFSSEFDEPFFLLGHSFGGRMAIKFAVKYPEKLKGLILVSTAGIKHKQNVFYLNFLASTRFVKSIFLKIPLLRNSFPLFRKVFYRFILRKTDYINAGKLPHLKETLVKIINEDLTNYLGRIKNSTLIIWGDKDKITPISDAYLMKEKIKNSKLETMEGVAHTPHLENPEILSQKIINFIKK